MATTPEWDHDEFFALFADAEVPEWSEPGDLSRFSIEAFTASVGWVDRASHGTIRMLGQGVTEHSVDLDAVGGLCQGFQRLVTNVAASRSGFRASRGRISQVVRQSTRLLLMASPAPGSVVLSLSSPALPPQVEVPLPGTDAPSSVLDEAVLDVLDLMAAARGLPPTPHCCLGVGMAVVSMGKWSCFICHKIGDGGENGWRRHYDTAHLDGDD